MGTDTVMLGLIGGSVVGFVAGMLVSWRVEYQAVYWEGHDDGFTAGEDAARKGP